MSLIIQVSLFAVKCSIKGMYIIRSNQTYQEKQGEKDETGLGGPLSQENRRSVMRKFVVLLFIFCWLLLSLLLLLLFEIHCFNFGCLLLLLVFVLFIVLGCFCLNYCCCYWKKQLFNCVLSPFFTSASSCCFRFVGILILFSILPLVVHFLFFPLFMIMQ